MAAPGLPDPGRDPWLETELRQTFYGKPDLCFWEQRLLLFVDGCYWHGCA